MTRKAAADFLDRYPQVLSLMGSALWDQIKRRYRLPDTDVSEQSEYIIRGDTVGTEDDLLVDMLARGGAPESSDSLARQLFTALSDPMQDVVMKELLRHR